jgi:hypothetical protein
MRCNELVRVGLANQCLLSYVSGMNTAYPKLHATAGTILVLHAWRPYKLPTFDNMSQY